ncbi:MAG: rRNA pseudouridine synthase [Candidatus Omnitrophica bacterium]|nr:rRNA pseudouridine synthase [Candidatus Omnitrophota bacterium]
MRLNKFLAQAGVSSRRGADLLIQSGRVTVNGIKVNKLGTLIDEKKDEISVNGKRVDLPEKFIYILLNKPKGYLCTVKDSFGRPTVLDLVGKDKSEFGSCGKVFPVGRLDLDTEGVLLLTNNGELTYQLTHPKFQVEKTYLVTIKGKINEKILKKFHKGIKLEDGKIAKAEATILKIPPEAGLKIEKGNSVLELKLKEGRKREIKRMCKAIGLPVVNLVRTKFANLTAKNLKPGAWRHLKEKEIDKLKDMVKLV